MTSVIDGIGFLIIILAFFGLPVALVGYGVWVALVRGVRPQPTDDATSEATESRDQAA